MSEENFKCVVCDTVGNWKNVDDYRFHPSGMCLCMTCGFITYPKIQQNTKDLTEFYRAEYREAPSVNNMFSGERKLHYHAEFLTPLFEEWKKQKLNNPKVLEIGSAFGMFLRWLKQSIPGADISGTELTLSFRRNAWWMYGIRLEEEPDLTKKYDLISSYKVAEHIPNIDVEIRKYAECLTENGHLYISVPTWFDSLTNFGMGGFSLEYYYHKNHINVWSKKLFEEVLRKCGLRVVKHNDSFYDDTYLCVRDDNEMSKPAHRDDAKARLVDLDKIKKAASFAETGSFDKAIEVWPNFPDAHINYYERNRGREHPNGFMYIKNKYILPALASCPNSVFITNFAADLHMRYEKYEDALEYLKNSLELKPNDPQALIAVGHCYRQMSMRVKDPSDKLKLIKEAKTVMGFLEKTSKQMSFDAITWMMQDHAMMPMPFEKEGNELSTPKKEAVG